MVLGGKRGQGRFLKRFAYRGVVERNSQYGVENTCRVWCGRLTRGSSHIVADFRPLLVQRAGVTPMEISMAHHSLLDHG